MSTAVTLGAADGGYETLLNCYYRDSLLRKSVKHGGEGRSVSGKNHHPGSWRRTARKRGLGGSLVPSLPQHTTAGSISNPFRHSQCRAEYMEPNHGKRDIVQCFFFRHGNSQWWWFHNWSDTYCSIRPTPPPPNRR